MPRDGNGNFSRTNGVFSGSTTWDDQANSADDFINSQRHDTHDQDIADALTDSLARDGQSPMTADLPMGGFKIANLADAVADTDGANLKTVKEFSKAENITYKAPGTNAVEITLQNILNKSVDPVYYGAEPDNDAVDDTQAWLDAMQAAVDQKCAIVPSPGTYAISDRIPNRAPIKGLDPNWCTLKAVNFVAANSKTFPSTSVNTTTDQISIASHGFTTAQPVTYNNGAGTDIGGLADLNVYWVIVVDSGTIQLALSESDANAGTQIDLTSQGTGSDHSVTLRRMMLDFNTPNQTGGDNFIKNINFDLNGVSGLNGWNSTSQGGGGSGRGLMTAEQIHFFAGANDAYAIEADSQIAEPGYLTGAVIDNLKTDGCHLAMKLGSNMDDTVFNSPRFNPNNATQGTETLPFLDLDPTSVVFNTMFIGGIRQIGWEIPGASIPGTRALIRCGQAANRKVTINTLFVESSASVSLVDLTHIFACTRGTKLDVNGLHINVEDTGKARCVVHQRIAATQQRGSVNIRNVTPGTSFGNPFKRLLESDRSNTSDDRTNGVSVLFDGIAEANFHDFPFGCVKNPAIGNQENDFFLDLHGLLARVRWDHAINEGNVIPRKGERLYTGTFNASTQVDTGADQITVTGHQYLTGDAILYEDQGGTAPGGLSDETIYFVIVVDADTIQLATSQDNAFSGTAINITSTGTGADHTITRMHKVEFVQHDHSGSLFFLGPNAASPETQTIRLPGAGIYELTAIFKRGGANNHMAGASFKIYYNNAGGSDDLLAIDQIGNSHFSSSEVTGLTAAAPNEQGDVDVEATYLGGSFSNRWSLTLDRKDKNN